MIHRKWSLLTGPVAILGGIVGSIVVANFIFVQNWFKSMEGLNCKQTTEIINLSKWFKFMEGLNCKQITEIINLSKDPFLKPERKLEKAPSTK
uniref:Uncharacterized protein n=1 Tax=Solanum lycopersicum TaxID=4081 RepID=A0A3Q7F6P7_SOLLC